MQTIAEMPDDTLAPVQSSAASGTAFRHLLVCLDRSEAAEAVLALASHIAKIDGARMTLLHVLAAPPELQEIRATDALEWDIVRCEASVYLASLAERVGGLGIEVDSRVGEGYPAHRVAALASELQADLLVLSTHGQGGIEPWTLGSTAHKILTLAQGPVLIVPAGAREPVPNVPLRCIFVPLDGSVRGECVLPTALRLARADGAAIVLAHVAADPIRTEVLSTPEDLALAHELADRLTARAEAYLERIRAQLVAGGARTRVVVSHATDQREGLVMLAAAERADLVVLSAHGVVCNPRRRFGSVTSYLIAHSTAPVLVIQDLPERASRGDSARPSRPPQRSSDAALSRS